MKKQEKCIHNKAIYPKMGVTCTLRKPDTLCKYCKSYKPKYIGWLGRCFKNISQWTKKGL